MYSSIDTARLYEYIDSSLLLLTSPATWQDPLLHPPNRLSIILSSMHTTLSFSTFLSSMYVLDYS